MKNYAGHVFALTALVAAMSVGLHYAAPQDADIQAIDTLLSVTETPAETVTAEEDTTTRARVAPIFDYSPGRQMLAGFRRLLGGADSLRRPVRIGFLGDSFIEGDLITADFRELMQNAYGGGGVGFVPITSQVSGFRQTVRHTFGEWQQRSIMAGRGSEFTISAYCYTPTGEGSYAEYRGSDHKLHLDRFERARLMYISRGRSTIRARVNGVKDTLFHTDPSAALQEALLEGDIRRVRYTINRIRGFTAYGVFLENTRGVSVDNFSVRGNTGVSMARINPALTARFGQLTRYDMIVLQYGLNMVSGQQKDYDTYRDQMTAVVGHIQSCFPGAAILIMSVGDRAIRRRGALVTMPGVPEMVEIQRQVAQNCGVLFWNTYALMQSLGGMATFVQKGWAAKDFTHIGARGGQEIARGLFNAITE